MYGIAYQMYCTVGIANLAAFKRLSEVLILVSF